MFDKEVKRIAERPRRPQFDLRTFYSNIKTAARDMVSDETYFFKASILLTEGFQVCGGLHPTADADDDACKGAWLAGVASFIQLLVA